MYNNDADLIILNNEKSTYSSGYEPLIHRISASAPQVGLDDSTSEITWFS